MASTLEAGDLSHYNGTAADHRYGPEGEVDASTGEYKQNVKATASESASTAALKARKRTKTGCLTCRKRRIKCGEERPTCKNCVKSKRDCEGYIPRVIFKDPLGAFRPSGGASQDIIARTHPSTDPTGVASIYAGVPSSSADPPLAPRPPQYDVHHGYVPGHGPSEQSTSGDLSAVSNQSFDPQLYSTSDLVPPLVSPYIPQAAPSYNAFHGPFKLESPAKSHCNPILYSLPHQYTTMDSGHTPETGFPDLRGRLPQSSVPSTAQSSEFPDSYTNSQMSNSNVLQSGPVHPQPFWLDPKPHGSLVSPRGVSSSLYPSGGGYIGPSMDLARDVIMQNRHQGITAPTPWVFQPDEENYNIDSGEEDSTIRSPVEATSSADLGLMIAMSANQYDGTFRSMKNFLNEPNILATYQPSYGASPLMDPQTARVFCHFVTATAPTLAVCERHPSNPGAIFSGAPAPKSQQALWSYTLPMLALRHQALLHSMLALGSLHISKLQQTSPTSSLKHYHYGLRRLGKALGNQKKRRDVATLAATLLLGYYEVTTAEHNKWNSHLSGARELVAEIDFAGMANKIEMQRRQQEEAETNFKTQMRQNLISGYDEAYKDRHMGDFPSRADRQLDENLINTIIGWKTDYNHYGHVVNDGDSDSQTGVPLTSKDIDNFDIQSDLFWWYAKQDMYQSIISRNRLLLSYDRWCLCPPRAPVGKINAVYGSMDHLLLLMGRMADFASRDQSRKMRVQREAERRSKAQNASQQGPPQTRATPSIPFYGMIPDPGPVRLPRGFDQAQHDRIHSLPLSSEDKSLETATRDAEIEWTSISHAFDVYLESLGPNYAPLSPEHHPPMATPFGPALYYRSYSIACVLNLFHCGRIIMMRVHPSMPPAAMAACGVAAPQTALYATTVGRICAGIQPVSNTGPLNPHHGAALMDCCMGLFHAGVQYQDPAQRGWTITKLRDTARLTGFQTSALIAGGCESAWTRAAEMGRGPPYSRTININAPDARMTGRDNRDPATRVRPPKDNNDRGFVKMNAGTRVYWAMGILGMEDDIEDDMKSMTLND